MKEPIAARVNRVSGVPLGTQLVDQIRDGSSGNYVLRVRAIGKMDQDTWSLNDFS